MARKSKRHDSQRASTLYKDELLYKQQQDGRTCLPSRIRRRLHALTWRFQAKYALERRRSETTTMLSVRFATKRSVRATASCCFATSATKGSILNAMTRLSKRHPRATGFASIASSKEIQVNLHTISGAVLLRCGKARCNSRFTSVRLDFPCGSLCGLWHARRPQCNACSL